MTRKAALTPLLLITALLSLPLMPPAVANHEINGLDPFVDNTLQAEWRGWVAYERVLHDSSSSTGENWSRSSRDRVTSGRWVDSSASSTDVVWSESDYRYEDFAQHTGWWQKNETAGKGERVPPDGGGSSQWGTANDLAGSRTPPLPYPPGEEGLTVSAQLTGSYQFNGVTWSPSRETATPIAGQVFPFDLRRVPAGVAVDLSDVPMMLSERKAYRHYEDLRYPPTVHYEDRIYQVCMSRSTIDTDGDGLPDDVDLAPNAAAPPVDLGIPGGPRRELIPAKLQGGPSGERGVPQCGEVQPPPPPPPEPITLTAVYDYAGGLVGPGVGAVGFDAATVRGNPTALARVQEICLYSRWTALGKYPFSDAGLLWNGFPTPFPDPLPGPGDEWIVLERIGGTRRNSLGVYGETLVITECGPPSLVRLLLPLEVSGFVRVMTSLTHSLKATVRSTRGVVVGECNVGSKTGKSTVFTMLNSETCQFDI